MKTAIVYSQRYLEHDPSFDHPESPSRLKAVMNGITKFRLLKTKKCTMVKPRKASEKEVELVHDSAYVKMIEHICKHGGGEIDEDTALSPKSYDIALLAVGGVLKASELVLARKFDNAFALVRPPGHHAGFCGSALSATSQGFCIFNNVAIAAMNLIKNRDLRRILILDIDVHHGNGTQEIFNRTSSVLYISLHQSGIYPHTGYIDEIGEGEGKGFKVNISLPPQSGDDIYLKAFDEIVVPISIEYKPQMVLMSAGFDCHKKDPLASMRLSNTGFLEEFDRALYIASETCSRKLAVALEGGYNLEVLSEVVPLVIAKLAGIKVPVKEDRTTSNSKVMNQAEIALREVKKLISPYWKIWT